MESNYLKIAVDFDGTIVEHRYPDIGEEMLFAFEALKMMQQKGYKLILWTYRTGEHLDAAVNYCKENGVEFYAVNKNFPEEKYDCESPRKIDADIYIDDKNIGGFPGWTEIWNMLDSSMKDFEKKEQQMLKKKKKGFKLKKKKNR